MMSVELSAGDGAVEEYVPEVALKNRHCLKKH